MPTSYAALLRDACKDLGELWSGTPELSGLLDLRDLIDRITPEMVEAVSIHQLSCPLIEDPSCNALDALHVILAQLQRGGVE